jgi:DNA polymerase III gamma/tau subunit
MLATCVLAIARLFPVRIVPNMHTAVAENARCRTLKSVYVAAAAAALGGGFPLPALLHQLWVFTPVVQPLAACAGGISQQDAEPIAAQQGPLKPPAGRQMAAQQSDAKQAGNQQLGQQQAATQLAGGQQGSGQNVTASQQAAAQETAAQNAAAQQAAKQQAAKWQAAAQEAQRVAAQQAAARQAAAQQAAAQQAATQQAAVQQAQAVGVQAAVGVRLLARCCYVPCVLHGLLPSFKCLCQDVF